MELLVSKKHNMKNSIVKIGDKVIGDGNLTIIGGPCTIESWQMLEEIALGMKAAGTHFLRGGAFKPRSSPYSFQGLEEEGLQLLSRAKKLTGLPTISEIVDPADLPLFHDVDILQIGAKNMQNYSLLKALAAQEKPVLLKRGWSNTIEEFLLSAEYLVSGGNPNVILCERGIRTFETSTRNSFDINAIALLKQITHLPVIADPSHGTGLSSLIYPVSMAAIAAGSDGIMIEVHNQPSCALCDGFQSVNIDEFNKLVLGAKKYEEIRRFD